jgi:hypothetical protein
MAIMLSRQAGAQEANAPRRIGAPVLRHLRSDRSFRAISAGHGNGRNLKDIPDFANGIRCAKNFSNAMDSTLTAGGNAPKHEELTQEMEMGHDHEHGGEHE